MLLNLFYCLRQHGVPVSIGEHIDLLNAMAAQCAFADQAQFYFLARAALVKDEKYFDRFDQAMTAFWDGVEQSDGLQAEMYEALIPEDWLRAELFNRLSAQDKEKIEALGGLDELLRQLKERLEQQQARHQGGNKWIGTGGTSPFGHGGYHPGGIRIGGAGQQGRAVKVWEQRAFRNLDDSVELGTRNIKMALRRLRRFAREGAADELDLEHTITSTARNAGLLDICLRAQRHNAIKVLMFFDSGGSMNRHVQVCEELFSAARTEFKHLEFYYFHNYLYESVWQDNRRRFSERTLTWDLLNRYNKDYKVIFVGDASMAPWEITYPGGSVEHYNDEPGAVWMQRVVDNFDKVAWLNPVSESQWSHISSTGIILEQLDGNMFPLTLAGLERGMRYLGGR